MDTSSSSEDGNPTAVVQNLPYDESLEVPDAEEVASVYTPTPRGGGMEPIRPYPARPAAAMGNRPNDTTSALNDDDSDNNGGSDSLEVKPIAGRPDWGKPQRPRGFTDGTKTSSSFDEDDDDSDASNEIATHGAYDPSDFAKLAVSADVRELFEFITRYTTQSMELDHRLRPFIPDYLPAVGDIDAFIKVPRPDADRSADETTLGLRTVDEPCAKQSDPTVLDLQFRSVTKSAVSTDAKVRSVGESSRDKEIGSWVASMEQLHRSQPPPRVQYPRPMPDLDSLMQEWPEELESMLQHANLPSADLQGSLANYVDIICALLDVPVYKNRLHSLHVVFSLYSEFKNSQHFKLAAQTTPPQSGKPEANATGGGDADTFGL